MITFDDLVPKPTDRAFFVGQTGSGKTTAAEMFLETRDYVVVLDGKGLVNFDGYTLFKSFRALTRSRDHKVIWRPSHHELRDWDAIDKFFEWVFRRTNTTVYIDETYTVTKGDEIPDYYHACLTRGREYGVETWSATQRPMRIPQVVMSESEHAYLFRLSMEQDRRKVASMCDIDPDVLKKLEKRVFFYAPQDGEVQGPLTLTLNGR